MIFVTLGTQAKDFSRLMKMVEELVVAFDIKDVVAQVGYTNFQSENIVCHSFIPVEQYDNYISKADIIISHAGTSAIFTSIKKGKKVIAVARLKKYGEMVNDHQLEIVRKLSKEGYIIDGTYSVVEAWKKIESFTPKKCDFECTLPQEIGKQIDEWLADN